GIQDGKIVEALVFKDSRLGVDISFESAVAIKMVGSNIQQDGDLGAESTNGLELETRHFKHDRSLRRGFLDQRDSRFSDVASNQSSQTTFCKNFADESCGRCLTV